MAYSIGQALYVVLRKETRVYPVQVVKVVTETTLDGDSVTYIVRAGSAAGTTEPKTLPLDQIDGEVFEAIDQVKTTLIERAKVGIVRLTDVAEAKAKEWYPNAFEAPTKETDDLTTLKKPDVPRSPRRRKERQSPEVEALAAELQQEAIDADDVIELPDGTKARIRTVSVPTALQG